MRTKAYPADKMQLHGKTDVITGPRTDTVVIQSPLGSLPESGYKCEHGVYIPATSADPNRAPFCSLCHPYLISKIPTENNNAG